MSCCCSPLFWWNLFLPTVWKSAVSQHLKQRGVIRSEWLSSVTDTCKLCQTCNSGKQTERFIHFLFEIRLFCLSKKFHTLSSILNMKWIYENMKYYNINNNNMKIWYEWTRKVSHLLDRVFGFCRNVFFKLELLLQSHLNSPERESSPFWLSHSLMRKAPCWFPSASSIFSASSLLVSWKYHLQTRREAKKTRLVKYTATSDYFKLKLENMIVFTDLISQFIEDLTVCDSDNQANQGAQRLMVSIILW